MRIETGSRNTEDRINGAKYPFFVRSQEVECINDYAYNCEAVLTAGDGVGTGKVFHYINGKFDAHQRVYVMSQFNGIDGKYFYYYFSHYFFDEVAKYTAKSSVDSVRRAMIANMEIPLPPIPEQRRIAEALSDTDALIVALEKLIAKKRAIKQGAMQELLTGKRRLPGFDGEWVEKPLDELLRYEQPQKYIVSSTEYADSGVPVLTAGKSLILGFTNERKGTYTNLPVIIFDDFTTESKLITYRFKVKSSAMKLLTTTGVCDIRIVSALMQMINFPLKDHKRYWIAEYSKLIVRIPANEIEQTAIATILSDMDEEIDALTAKLNKIRYIKQGMMSELLPGRIRLVEQEAITEAVAAPKVVKLPKREPKPSTVDMAMCDLEALL